MIFIFLNGHTEQFSDRMALKPKMDTVCTLLDFVGIGVYRFSWCLPDASRCLPDAFPMLSDAFLMPSRCLTDAFRCFPDCFPMPSDARFECLPNSFPMPRQSLPHIIPFKSLPNSFAWIPSQLFFLSNTLLPQDKTSERHREAFHRNLSEPQNCSFWGSRTAQTSERRRKDIGRNEYSTNKNCGYTRKNGWTPQNATLALMCADLNTL